MQDPMDEGCFEVQCPWCWEWIVMYVDPDSSGQMIEDCEVCCRPWLVRVTCGIEGSRSVYLERA